MKENVKEQVKEQFCKAGERHYSISNSLQKQAKQLSEI